MAVCTRDITIAGLPARLKLTGATGEIKEGFNKRYSKFKTYDSKYAYKIELKFSGSVSCSRNISYKFEGSVCRITGRGMEVEFSEKATCGRVFGDIHILDSLLRIIYSRMLINQGGFLIHAAASAGELYTGPAGSGKTTSVRGDENMLGDDIIALKKTNGRWRIFSTPFTGEFEGLVENTSEKLNRINILTCGGKKINEGKLYTELLKNSLYYIDYNCGLGKLSNYIADIAGSVPGRGYFKESRRTGEAAAAGI
jgi:hypothetical protein